MTGDRGGVTIVVVAMMGLLVVLALSVSSVGVLLAERERAVSAAEAAALAAAVATYPPAGEGSPRQVASEFAGRNGGEVVTCVCPVDPTLRSRIVVVTVAVTAEVPVFGKVRIGRTARAEFDPLQWMGW
jgi:secretion/DNA translocation related TadE-like protein